MDMDEKNNNEQALRDEFKDRVQKTTLDQLPDLIKDLIDRDHDYGSICVAMGIAAATTAWAMNKHKNGGITGFQAGAVAWEMLRHWGALYPGECGGRMQDFNDLLYPQCADKFQSIPRSALEMAQKVAVKNLEGRDGAHPSVIAHWESLARGDAPFGLRVEN